MEASEMKKVKELEAENTRLKRMYANLAMELDVAKHIIEKKALKPCHKRDMVEQFRIEYPQSVSKACRILKMSRSVLHYKSIKDDNFLLRFGIISRKHPREGFGKVMVDLEIKELWSIIKTL